MRLVLILAASVALGQSPPRTTTRAQDTEVEDALPQLSQAAGRFAGTAQEFYCHETLRQRVLGDGPRRPGQLRYFQRQIVSYYAFTTLGDATALREIRQLLTLDNVSAGKEQQNGAILREAIAGRKDDVKHRLLTQFEDVGLKGVATDLGQLVLLFGKTGIQNYAFEFDREETQGYNRTIVLKYEQTKGREAVHINERGKQKKDSLRGWVWLRLPDYLPVRITMITTRHDGKREIRDEAEVDYSDALKALLPTEVIHRRYEDDLMTAEDDFQYANWELIPRP